MSGIVVSWAFEQKTGSPTTKLVLVKLASHAPLHGHCWPSIEKIAEEAELALSTVYKHLAILQGSKLLRSFDHAVGKAADGKPIVRRGYQLAVPPEWREAPSGKGTSKNKGATRAGGMKIPGDGKETPSRGEMNPPGGIAYIRNEPSRNRHSLAERENNGPPWAEEKETEPTGPDPKAWSSDVMVAYRELPAADKCAPEYEARQRWLAIPWNERPTTEELVDCIKAWGQELTRINSQRPPGKPQMVRHLSNWIKERCYEGVLATIRARHESALVRLENSDSGNSTIASVVIDALKSANFSDTDINIWFGKGTVVREGPPVEIVVSTSFRRDYMTNNLGRRLKRAFGDDVVIRANGDS